MKIGILGATGAVGRQMIQCLEEQNIPVDELRLFASARSAGGTLPFKGQDIVIEEVFVSNNFNVEKLNSWKERISNSNLDYLMLRC